MRLQVYSNTSSVIFVRVVPSDRSEFAQLLATIGDGELIVESDNGVVRFASSTRDSVDASDLSDICFTITDVVIQYIIDSIEKHAREQEYHPFNCGFSELGASICPRTKNIVIQATSFFDIYTQEEMDKFLESIGYFHDAVVREIAVVGNTYIDSNGWMHNGCGSVDARFVIHTQYPQPACIDIVMEGIQTLRLDGAKLPDMGLIGIIADDGAVISGNPAKNGDEMVLAKSMRYRILGRDFLDKQLHAVSTDIRGHSGTLEVDADTSISISPLEYT